MNCQMSGPGPSGSWPPFQKTKNSVKMTKLYIISTLLPVSVNAIHKPKQGTSPNLRLRPPGGGQPKTTDR